jgi:hypothetical protein
MRQMPGRCAELDISQVRNCVGHFDAQKQDLIAAIGFRLLGMRARLGNSKFKAICSLQATTPHFE